ncbi:hypothetical protein L1785_14955, partial [Antribacter sp. KLBMP9083]
MKQHRTRSRLSSLIVVAALVVAGSAVADIGTATKAVAATTQIDDSVVSGTNRFTYGSGWGTATGVGDLNQGTAHWSNTTGAVAT